MEQAATYLDALNPAQREAVVHGVSERAPGPPLLVIAGAGSGKTHTLAHRVAHLVVSGADPRRILLLTFTRRAAAEMSRRVERLVTNAWRRETRAQRRGSSPGRDLPRRGQPAAARSTPGARARAAFTVLDRATPPTCSSCCATRRGLSKTHRRFPKKGTCLAIYSRVVNAREPLDETLAEHFPWCAEWQERLKRSSGLHRAQAGVPVLDYDDLLLYWHASCREPALAARVRERFDHVLVDEYQDTNTFQAEILDAPAARWPRRDGGGRRRAVDLRFPRRHVRNILDFPAQFRRRRGS